MNDAVRHDPALRPEAVSAELERLILDTADEGFCLFSAGDSRLIAFNQRFVDIFGFDPEWVNAEPTVEAVTGAIWERQQSRPPDRAEYVQRVLKRHDAPGGREMELELRSGRFVVGRTQAARGGERLYTFRDVTSERRILEQLQAERQRLASLVEHAPVAMYIINCTTGMTTQVSRSIRNVSGQEAESFIGPSIDWERHVHPEDRPLVRRTIAGAIAGQHFYDIDYRYVRPDGTVRWLRDTAGPLPVAEGMEPQIAGVVMDITRQKTAEEELRQSERRFRELIEGVSDFIFYEHDVDRRLTYVSPSVERMLGYRAEELLGHRFGEFHPDHVAADLARAHESVAAAIETKRRQPQYEVVLRRKSGEPVLCEIMEYPVVAHGEVTGFHGVARDITDLRDMQQRLRERERLAILGTFAGGLAHDLNNLLLPIRAGLDVLERDPDPSKVADRVNSIRRATDHIAELTKNLLMWTRHESSQTSALSTTATEIRPWLEEALPFYRDAVRAPEGEPAIDVRLDLRHPPAQAKIDGGLLKQAILNLFLNARDAMTSGGLITLTVDRSPPSWADSVEPLSAAASPGEYDGAERAALPGVRFVVTDEGCGMDESVLRRAFDPFFSTKARGKSTGLGLALVGSIVRSAQGQVQIRSRLGHGTSIILDVPAADRSNAVAARVESTEVHSGNASTGRMIIGLRDPRVAAFVRTGLAALGAAARIDNGEPEPDDVVWVLDPALRDPEYLARILKVRRDLAVVALGPRDDRPGWPEAILWLDGPVDASAFRRIVDSAARQGSRVKDRVE